MHPHQASWLVQHRMEELQQAASDHHLAGKIARDRPTPLRRRAGWWLVGVGLKLATGRGHQGRFRTAPSAP